MGSPHSAQDAQAAEVVRAHPLFVCSLQAAYERGGRVQLPNLQAELGSRCTLGLQAAKMTGRLQVPSDLHAELGSGCIPSLQAAFMTWRPQVPSMMVRAQES